MHIRFILLALLIACVGTSINAQQKVIQLYKGAAPGSENWNWDEKENDKNLWNAKVVLQCFSSNTYCISRFIYQQ